MNEGAKLPISSDPPGDEGIDLSDIPELGEEFFQHAQLREALIEKHSALVDREVYEWFQSQGPDYLRRMNQLLRDYMLAHRDAKIAK